MGAGHPNTHAPGKKNMAKLESADEFIELVKSGKYETKVNAQRGCGRTRLSDSEKKKAFAFIDKYFPDDGTAPAPAAKPGKKKVAAKKFTRMAKKVKKKKASRVAAPVELEEDTDVEEEEPDVDAPDEEEAEAEEAKPARRVKKKASKRSPAGALPISPSEVKSVGDVLTLVDSTVKSSVSVINALRQAHEVSSSGDIDKGIQSIKLALEGVANLLYQSVAVPLASTSHQADPEVAARLTQVVAATAPQEEAPLFPGYSPPLTP